MRRWLLLALLAFAGPALGQSLIPGTQVSGTAGGDLTGSYPNPTLAKINGTTIAGVTGTAGNFVVLSASPSIGSASLANSTMTGTTTLPNGGQITASGGLTTAGVGGYIAAQGSGNPTSGSGVELNGGATPFMLAYNRTGNAYLPLTLDGSSIPLQLSGSTVATLDSTGLQLNTLSASLPVYTDAAKHLTSTAPAGYSAVLSGTTGSIGGSALAAGACAAGTATVTGATTSMVATTSPSADPDSTLTTGVGIYAFVSSANTVTVRICAIVAVTPAATTYNVRVLQ